MYACHHATTRLINHDSNGTCMLRKINYKTKITHTTGWKISFGDNYDTSLQC